MPDFDLEASLKDVPRANLAKRLLKSYVVIEGDAVRAHARILRDIEFFESSDIPERAVILKTVLQLLNEQAKS